MNHELTSRLPQTPPWLEWRNEDLARLHEVMGLSLIPMRGKIAMVKWRNGPVDYVQHKPTDAEVVSWAAMAPDGWAVICGGASKIVVLDVEAAGLRDASDKGQAIRQVLAALPESCTRATPNGGQHAYLRVTDAPAPPAKGCRLVEALPAGARKPVLLAEYRGELQIAVILGPGRGVLAPDFHPHPVRSEQLKAFFSTLRAVSDVQPAHKARADGTHPVGAPSDDVAPAVAEASVRKFLQRMPPGPPCQRMREALDLHDRQLLRSGQDRTSGCPA